MGQNKKWYAQREMVQPTQHVQRWKPADRARCMTYAIAALEVARVKVGRTAHWEDRFAKLVYASPVELTLLAITKGDFEVELHRAMRDHHSHGEWYVLNLETRTLIEMRLNPGKLGLRERLPASGNRLREPLCKICQQPGHYAKTCKQGRPQPLQLALTG